MRVHTKTVWEIESGRVLSDESYEYAGPVARCDRAAQSAASAAATTAANTGAAEGADASGINSTLTPFLTQQLLHPQGYSQQDLTQQLNAGAAGAGGAASAITGDAADMAARTRNPSGFTSALDEAARDRDKAAAGSSEQVAANDAGVKLQQQQEAAKQLGGQEGMDSDAMLKSMGLQTGDINAGVNAGDSGWLQNAMSVLKTVGGLAGGAGQMMTGLGPNGAGVIG
jgi:hypothetical protein